MSTVNKWRGGYYFGVKRCIRRMKLTKTRFLSVTELNPLYERPKRSNVTFGP